MNIQRTDIFLIVIVYLQLQIVFELIKILSFDAISAAINGVSFLAVLEVITFIVATTFALKGLLLAIEAFFYPEGKNQILEAKSAGYALIASAFLLVTLIIIIRSSVSY